MPSQRYISVPEASRDVASLSRRLQETAREIANAQRETNMILESINNDVYVLTGATGTIPTALTDLDTTVTGAQLDGKHLAGTANTSSALGLTASATYVQSEVQSVADKLDELIGYFAALVGILDAALITGTAASSFLLLESGDYFLLETGDKLILE